MSFDLMQTCSSSNQPVATTVTLGTASNSLWANLTNLVYKNAGQFNFTDKKSIYSMVSRPLASWTVTRTCSAPNNPIAITTSNTAAVTHYINNGSYYFNVSQSFTGDEECDDYFRTYTNSIHPTTP